MELGLEEVFSARSTNGRWGMSIVAPLGTKLPARGTLAHKGKVQGVDVYTFTPDEKVTQWVAAFNKAVKIHGGATLVQEESLQSGQWASVLLLAEMAVVEVIGYEGRYSKIRAFYQGRELDIPAPILLVMGLATPAPEAPVEIPAPPAPLEGAMQAAFKRLLAEKGE